MPKDLLKILVIGLLFVMEPSLSSQRAALVAAYVTTDVTASVQIAKKNDILFSAGLPGDPPQAILAEDSSHAAGVQLIGIPYQTFNVHLPLQIKLALGEGNSADSRVSVSGFRCLSGTAILTASGAATQQVGALREALRQTQKPGLYQGTFLVTVVYP